MVKIIERGKVWYQTLPLSIILTIYFLKKQDITMVLLDVKLSIFSVLLCKIYLGENKGGTARWTENITRN